MNKITESEEDLISNYFSSNLPILLSSPHSGRVYPDEFLKLTDLKVDALRVNEDMFVDELFNCSSDLNLEMLKTETPRIVIDLNRNRYDIDKSMLEINDQEYTELNSSKYSKSGFGLISKMTSNGEYIYSKPLKISEINERVNKYYTTWHNKLDCLTNYMKNSFTNSVLLDCHSMPSSTLTNSLHQNLDIILGDNSGKSSDQETTNFFAKKLEEQGFKVKVNYIFSGGYITCKYGDPNSGLNAIQIEVNKAIYMNEKKFTMNENFIDVKTKLVSAINELLHFIKNNNNLSKAAE